MPTDLDSGSVVKAFEQKLRQGGYTDLKSLLDAAKIAEKHMFDVIHVWYAVTEAGNTVMKQFEAIRTEAVPLNNNFLAIRVVIASKKDEKAYVLGECLRKRLEELVLAAQRAHTSPKVKEFQFHREMEGEGEMESKVVWRGFYNLPKPVDFVEKNAEAIFKSITEYVSSTEWGRQDDVFPDINRPSLRV